MNRRQDQIFLIFGLILAGCATAYQPKGLMGGYSHEKLEDGVYRVEFKGNSYTDKQMAEDFALLRCAEVALENGYSHFAIEDTESYYRSKERDADPIKAGGSVIQLGNKGTSTDDTPRKQAKPFSRTFHRNTIRCYKEKPAGAIRKIYDARQTLQDIKTSYNLQK